MAIERDYIHEMVLSSSERQLIFWLRALRCERIMFEGVIFGAKLGVGFDREDEGITRAREKMAREVAEYIGDILDLDFVERKRGR